MEEQFGPDRTILTLPLENKRRETSGDNKRSGKTIHNMKRIRECLQMNGEAATSVIAEYIGLSETRTGAILSRMEDVEAKGNTTKRVYLLSRERKG